MLLFYDNNIAIKITNNLIQTDWTKHIELNKNYIKENLNADVIRISYIKNSNQLT